MFGWRRRSEGFEWREYVRTTVLVRRADRQRRIDDARLAAVAKVSDAKDRGIEAGKAGVDAAANIAANAASNAGRGLWAGMTFVGRGALHGAKGAFGFAKNSAARALPAPRPAAQRKARLNAANPAPPNGSLKDRLKAYRDTDDALDVETVSLPPVRAAKKERAALTPRSPRQPWRIPQSVHLIADVAGSVFAHPHVKSGLRWSAKAAAAIAVILIGGQMLRGGDGLSVAALAPSIPSLPAIPSLTAEPLSGRATALTGDRLRIGGETIQLSGIVAPDANQPCLKANGRRWSCNTAARRALDRTVRGAPVSCTPSGTDAAGAILATCMIGVEDIAKTLVREGHVFASSGMFATYKADEDAARGDRLGLWQGDTVHPDEWRERVWQEAKRTAPDGCPIKGYVRASTRLYAMPWSADYTASKFRSAKTEHWFCSEEEARAAGFKAASS